MGQKKYQAGIAAAAALALSFLYMAVIYVRFGFIYSIADDIIMRDIAAGVFTGTPDGRVIFMKYVLGWFISRFYRIVPTVDWYGFLLVGTIFLGLAAFLYRGFASDKKMVWKLVYGLFVLLLSGHIVLEHVAQFEWTTCAAFVGAAALFFYVTLSGRWESLTVWGSLLLVYCVRNDIFWMLMPGFSIFYLWKHVTYEKGARIVKGPLKGKSFPWKIEHWQLPAAVFAGVILIMEVERMVYSGPEWEAYSRFQTARSDVYDYYDVPAYEKNPEFFEEEGISEAQLRNFRHYALYLVDGIGDERMTTLAQEAKRQYGEQGLKAQLKWGVVLASREFLGKNYYPLNIYAIALALYLLVYGWRKDKKGMGYVLLILFFQGCLWYALGFKGRLPARVSWSLHMADFALMLGALYQMQAYPKGRVRKGLLVAGGLLFLMFSVISWRDTLTANREKLVADGNYQLFKEYCKEQGDALFFVEAYLAEPLGGAQVTTSGDFTMAHCLTLGDWYSTSPLDGERFKALGIRDLEEAFLSGREMYFVSPDKESSGFFGDYMEGTYENCRVSLADVVVIEDREYYLYQVETGEQ